MDNCLYPLSQLKGQTMVLRSSLSYDIAYVIITNSMTLIANKMAHIFVGQA